MRASKFLAVAITATLLTTSAFGSSIGRSGGGGHSSSSSVSRPSPSNSSRATTSHSAPSKPAVAPAPSQPGGIGGTSSSVGVRKSEVTNGVKQDIATSKPAPAGGVSNTPSTSPSYSSPPSYGAPAPVVVQSGGGGFGTTFMGALTGSMVGNALFGNHGSSGTTVINNGTPGGSGAVASGPGVVGGNDAQFNPGGVSVQSKKEYGVWNFIGDLIGFVIIVAILIGMVWLFYKGFQLIRNYVNKERGVSTQPFNPTGQFWRIQRAFAEANITELKVLLGPDIVDELTNGLTTSTLTLKNVSHEVRLANNTEFSIWYKFEDAGSEVNQVWHYEKFGKDWKLNGIENV